MDATQLKSIPEWAAASPERRAPNGSTAQDDQAWRQTMEKTQLNDWFQAAVGHTVSTSNSLPTAVESEISSAKIGPGISATPGTGPTFALSPLQIGVAISEPCIGLITPGSTYLQTAVSVRGEPDSVYESESLGVEAKPCSASADLGAGTCGAQDSMHLGRTAYQSVAAFSQRLDRLAWVPATLVADRSKLRVYVQQRGGFTEVWLGLDRDASVQGDDLSRMVKELQRLAQASGLQLSALVLNGEPVWRVDISAVSTDLIKEV